MLSPVTRSSVILRYSPSFLAEIDRVIDLNLDKVALVALFISRLLKGIQNLTSADEEVTSAWGMHSYDIEDIGTVDFRLFMNPETAVTAIAIEQIRWRLSSSRFFSSFDY